MTRLECGASEVRADRIVAGSVDPEKLVDVWEYEPPKGKVVTEIDLLRASVDREERLRRRADMAILAALLAILAGVAIALVVPSAQADEIEVEWTWRVAPSDRLNAESLQRIRKAEMRETAQRAFDALREWSAQHAVQTYEEPTYEAYSDPTYYEPMYRVPSYANDFASQGVVYEDGTRYTWYSSNSAYHYRTPEWSVDPDGFYRDSEGYYVVASTDVPMGGTVETPWGDGKVYDTGCDSGTVDLYTAF